MKDTLSTKSLAHGTIVREPVGAEQGYWVGAPGVFFDESHKTYYLTYRIRQPRGVDPDRGAEARIARSHDGVRFEDVWSVTKDVFSSTSIERCAVRRGLDGQWRYYVSFVDPADSRWCIAVLKAGQIDQFNASNAQRLLTAPDLNFEGIKDPWIFEFNGQYCMIVSVAVATTETSDQSHTSCDIFNTGQCRSATGLATSNNLDTWQWRGILFAPPVSGWDAYTRRINSVVFHDRRWIAPYDGIGSHEDNYEEKTGLAELQDLRTCTSLTTTGPAFTSPHASGSLRYMDLQSIQGRYRAWYEFARSDGSHDLRAATFDELKPPL